MKNLILLLILILTVLKSEVTSAQLVELSKAQVECIIIESDSNLFINVNGNIKLYKILNSQDDIFYVTDKENKTYTFELSKRKLKYKSETEIILYEKVKVVRIKL